MDHDVKQLIVLHAALLQHHDTIAVPSLDMIYCNLTSKPIFAINWLCEDLKQASVLAMKCSSCPENFYNDKKSIYYRR